MKVVKSESSIAKEMTLEQAKVLREFMKAQDVAEGRGKWYTYRIKARGPRKIHGVHRDLPLHLGESFALYRHDNDSFWDMFRVLWTETYASLTGKSIESRKALWWEFKRKFCAGDVPEETKIFWEKQLNNV